MRKLSIIIASVFLLALSVPCLGSDSSDAAKVVREFYTDYLNFDARRTQHLPRPKIAFSKSFERDLEISDEICKKYAEGPCGFGRYGDPYVLSQENPEAQTAKEANLKVTEKSAGLIQVRFNLWPSSGISTSIINYEMIEENGKWVVDDIIYLQGGGSERAALKQESENNQKHGSKMVEDKKRKLGVDRRWCSLLATAAESAASLRDAGVARENIEVKYAEKHATSVEKLKTQKAIQATFELVYSVRHLSPPATAQYVHSTCALASINLLNGQSKGELDAGAKQCHQQYPDQRNEVIACIDAVSAKIISAAIDAK